MVDNLLPQVHKSSMKSYKKDDIEFYCVDIGSYDALSRLKVSGQFKLLHMASETGTGESYVNSSFHLSTNAIGTLNIFKWAQLNNMELPKLVNLSSRAVYGEGTYNIDGKKINALPRKNLTLVIITI